MKRVKRACRVLVSVCLSLMCISSCKDDPSFFKGLNAVNITIENGQSVMTNTNLETGEAITSPLVKAVGSQGMFDELTKSVGYVSHDSTFNLINPLTGSTVTSFPIAHRFRQGAIDSERRTFSYIHQTTNSVYDLRIATHSLDDGALLADSNIQGDRNFSQGLEVINPDDHHYYTKGEFLYAINAMTGDIERALTLEGRSGQYSYLDKPRQRLIEFGTRLSNNGDNALRIYDLENGSQSDKHTVIIPYELVNWGWPIHNKYVTNSGDKFLIDNRYGSTFYIDTKTGDLLLEEKHSRKGYTMLFWEFN